MVSIREPDQTNREQDTKRRRTVAWVVGISTAGLVFDGYDLTVYGTVVSTFLGDPSQLGEISPAQAGALGSYALIGVLVGALLAGAVGDIIGRRRIMLLNFAWFSIGMGLTAFVPSANLFGLGRFVTGIGVGALVATAGAIAAEFAPPGKKNLCNAIVYSGFSLGGVLAAFLAILLLGAIGWRGMFLIGALPLITLLPLAAFKLPESVAWLASRGRIEEARKWSAKTGVPVPAQAPTATTAAKPARVGFVGLFRDYTLPTILLGFMSASGLLLVYGLNTWLPHMMGLRGFGAQSSLTFLLLLNAGAVIGALVASRVADRFGPKPVVASTFLIGAVSIALLTTSIPIALLLLLVVAIAGLGTTGTQVLIYGFVSNYYRTNVRAAGVAWCAGFGRLGGVGGPLLGGLLIAAGITVQTNLYIFAGVALLGMLLCLTVPSSRREPAVMTPVTTSVGSGQTRRP